MTERETVIKKLQEALDDAENNGNIYAQIRRPVVFNTIAMLKEQEPKAIEYHDNPFTGLPVAYCPNCKRYARQFHSAIEEETHYCPWCGQEVKWE